MTDATLRKIAEIVCKADELEVHVVSEIDVNGEAICNHECPFADSGCGELRVALRVEALERHMYDVAAELGGT